MTLNAELSSIRGRLVWPVEALPIHFGTGDIRRNHGTSAGLFPWTEADSGLQSFGAKQAFREKEEVGKLAELHEGKAKTPTMGGLLIFGTVFVSTVFWAEPSVYRRRGDDGLLPFDLGRVCGRLPEDFKKEQQRVARQVQTSRPTAYDGGRSFDSFGSPRRNLNWSTGKAVGSSSKMLELWVPFYKGVVLQGMSLILVFILFMLTLCGSSNAINLTDGLDGLAIGCTVTVALTYGIMAYAAGNYLISDYLRISFVPGTGELAVVCAALLGGSLSFLWYNAHPAEVFMGDTGSLAIGGSGRSNRPHDSSAADFGHRGRNFRHGSRFSHFAGGILQEPRKKNFSNVTDSSSLRVERMEGNQGGDQVLDSFASFCNHRSSYPETEIG